MVQLSHPHMTTGKTKALSRWTFVGKVMSLLFKMLSRLVIAFLPRSKLLLISWLQSTSAVILEPKKIKSVAVSSVSPSICHEEMGPDAMMIKTGVLVRREDSPILSYLPVSLHTYAPRESKKMLPANQRPECAGNLNLTSSLQTEPQENNFLLLNHSVSGLLLQQLKD